MSLDWQARDGVELPEDFFQKTQMGAVYVNPDYRAVIFATIPLGINDLKDETEAERLFRREVMWARAVGRPPYFTLETALKCVGISTNSAKKTDAAFKRDLMVELEEAATHAVEDEYARMVG